VDLHKLLVSVDYDNEKQMLSIFAHVHLGVVDDVIIHAYVKSCTKDGYNDHSMTLYYLIDIKCFLDVDDLIHNPPSDMLVICTSHGMLLTTTNKFVNIILIVHFC
jgi:hypothetical protein